VVQDSAALAPGPTVTPLGNGRFNVTLRTSDSIASGLYRGSLRLRMCAETPCVNVIQVATRLVPYRFMINWVNPGEWETFQRDAGHRGYVPIVVHPSRIHKAWEWQTPNEEVYVINPVATAAGMVFVSDRSWFASNASLFALSESSGVELWRQDFPDFYLINPPATSGGKVFMATTGHDKTFLFAFQASDGAPVFQASFNSQWPRVFAPVIDDGVAYTSGGDGGIWAFDAGDGMPLWARFSGDDDMTTPAVEDGKVYHHDDMSGMHVYDSANGNTLSLMADPMSPEYYDYSYDAAPMLGSTDHVFSFSGNTWYEGNYGGRFLVDYSPANNASRWISAKRYTGKPAFKDGVIYATSNNPKALDAIDEATGVILWSWVPNPSDVTFHNNVVVTKNVAFVTTNRATYAIDLTTRQPVWSTPTPGQLAISGNGTLYIIPGTTPATLMAFKLR